MGLWAHRTQIHLQIILPWSWFRYAHTVCALDVSSIIDFHDFVQQKGAGRYLEIIIFSSTEVGDSCKYPLDRFHHHYNSDYITTVEDTSVGWNQSGCFCENKFTYKPSFNRQWHIRGRKKKTHKLLSPLTKYFWISNATTSQLASQPR